MMNIKIYEKMKMIVKDCGKLIKDVSGDFDIQEKEGNNNIVTKYDVLIQQKLEEELLKLMPDAVFIGEEGDEKKESKKGYKFIVDPIDGTTNFSRNLNNSAISVALLKDEEPIIGICYIPYTDELYEARKGFGAYLNGKKIHVSNKTLKNGIVFSGCAPYYDELRKRTLEVQCVFASIASDFRRFGSAVIEICSVASGKAELYFELRLMPWDFAAAGLILEEAGGVLTTMEGKKPTYDGPTSLMATNGVEDYLKYL